MGLVHGCEAPSTKGSVAGRIVLAPELASKVDPSDTLFVIVRRPGESRPLAVKRIDHPEFPVHFEITSADVMMPGSELRGMVEVIARVDKDGKAGPPQPGDLEGEYDKNPTLPGGKDIEIVIRKVY
jgi:cytochrome c-type biogenesis protein CcmH